MRFSLLATCAVAAVACSDPVTPTQQLITLDYTVAEANGALATSPVYFVMNSGPAPMVPPAVLTCPFDATSKMFVCPSQTESGVTFRLSYQLLDASFNPLSSRDSAATAAVRTVRTVDGAWLFNGDTLYQNVQLRSDHILSGLLVGPHRLNGTDTLSLTLRLNTSKYTTTDAVTTTNFQPKARVPGAYPLGGTITTRRWLTLFPEALGAPYATYVMTFDGTSTASWTRTIYGVTSNCTYNMSLGGSSVCTPAP